jgi:hypothetical protein
MEAARLRTSRLARAGRRRPLTAFQRPGSAPSPNSLYSSRLRRGAKGLGAATFACRLESIHVLPLELQLLYREPDAFLIKARG